MAEQRKYENWRQVYAPAINIIRMRVPLDIEEFPTPYEFGKMERGEWD
jgi:hypothetical protein